MRRIEVIGQYVGEEVEIRGIISPVQVRSNQNDVDYIKTCIGGHSGLVQVIVNDEVVGVIDHINWFTTQISTDNVEVVYDHIGVKPWDIVRIVGTVRLYPDGRDACIEDIRVIEVL